MRIINAHSHKALVTRGSGDSTAYVYPKCECADQWWGTIQL